MNEKTRVLSSEEIQNLILAIGRGQHDGFSDEDAQALVDWATEVRINHEILTLALEGRINASIGPDGGVLFSKPETQP